MIKKREEEQKLMEENVLVLKHLESKFVHSVLSMSMSAEYIVYYTILYSY